ncbi:hypothetical protein [Nocardia brevicatena]|nr:hypothetical protein [Nocardia brevicatena]
MVTHEVDKDALRKENRRLDKLPEIVGRVEGDKSFMSTDRHSRTEPSP